MRCGGTRLTRPALLASSFNATMSKKKPSSVKVFLTMFLSLVLLCVGVAVLIGVFGLLVRLFGAH
jgi:hypothetical protein